MRRIHRAAIVLSMLLGLPARGEHPATMPWAVNRPIVSVRKELIEKHPKPQTAPCIGEAYVGPDLRLWQRRAYQSLSDNWHRVEQRFSDDNGRTWSPYEPLGPTHKKVSGVIVIEGGGALFYDNHAGVLLGLYARIVPQAGFFNCCTYVRISHDYGRTWGKLKQLRYEEGEDYDPSNPLKPGYLKKNLAQPGDPIIRHSSGTVLVCAGHANAPDDPDNAQRKEKAGALCFIGRWDAGKKDYDWVAGKRVTGSPKITSRGMAEPVIAELKDRRILMLLRGSDTPQTPGRRWYAVSGDGGVTFSDIRELKYDDGSSFYTPSTMCGLLRHSVTGRLYYFGNISPVPPRGNWPRYPLIIAEVDETALALKKSTVTVIDDRRPGQSDQIQFSNFSLLENRATHEFELIVTLLGERPGEHWATADCYKYWLTLAKSP
ncbi:MAG: exo-alpha-sialidase [Phycisphaerae bacterium]|nr:exo-alpha-sialidase [Phycisphaerae bacterium]